MFWWVQERAPYAFQWAFVMGLVGLFVCLPMQLVVPLGPEEIEKAGMTFAVIGLLFGGLTKRPLPTAIWPRS